MDIVLNERDFSAEQRKAAASSGAAMPDGSYPIENKSDLENAIRAIGRATDPAAVKAHIKTRAKALGATDSLPDGWKESAGRVLAGELISLTEAGYDPTKGELTVTVIKPGMSKNKRFYPKEVLQKSHKIFDGAKMFADHQTEAESKHRPEGSVNNWVATLGSTWVEGDGTIMGKATVIDPQFKAKLDRLAETKMLGDMGVSIRAIGEASDMEHEGAKCKMVESLLAARSVDFVTYAGAGGRVEAMESSADPNDVDLISEADLRSRRPDLVSLIEAAKEKTMEKTLQEQLTEAQAALATKTAELTEAQTKLSEAATAQAAAEKTAAQAEIAKLLTESKLPAQAQERLKTQFAEVSKLDGVAEAITKEVEYIKSLGVVTKKNGAEQNQESDKKVNLEESFKGLGMSEAEAKIAASAK